MEVNAQAAGGVGGARELSDAGEGNLDAVAKWSEVNQGTTYNINAFHKGSERGTDCEVLRHTP